MTEPTAVETPEQQLRAYLATHVACARLRGVGTAGWRYAGPADLLLQTGTVWTPAPLPADIRPGIPRVCFENAYRLARRSRGALRYVEGYALGYLLPVEHAWCVDAEGRVVDNTWTDDRLGQVYLGVVVDLALVRRSRNRRKAASASALFDWYGGYPLLPRRPAADDHLS